MKTWRTVALIAYISMCFIISPLVLDGLKLEWKKRQIIGMFMLIAIFTFVFSYRFDSLDFIILVKNFGILTVIVFPVWILLAWPIAKNLAKKLTK
jgi:hypothetical protein